MSVTSKRRILFAAIAATLLGVGGWLWYDEARGGRFARMAGSDDAEDRLAGLHRVLREAAQAMPTHQHYINKHCRAERML